MKRLVGFFKRDNERINERTDIVRVDDNRQFKIISNTVRLSEPEADMIIKIVHEEMGKTKQNNIGYVIAWRITEEVNTNKICTAHVNGGDDGKNWLIQVSNNPREFID